LAANLVAGHLLEFILGGLLPNELNTHIENKNFDSYIVADQDLKLGPKICI